MNIADIKDTKKFLLLDAGQPFNFETPYLEPLGGSETSILLLSKGLAELGQSVVILTSNTVNIPQQESRRLLHNINSLPGILPESDIVIFNRNLLSEELYRSDKRLFCYCHDAYDQQHIISWMLNPIFVQRIEKFLCVSEWQAKTFSSFMNIPEEKLVVIGNALDESLYYGYTERNPNKLMFAGIPYKGIEAIGDLFEDICIQGKRDDLEFHIFSSMGLYGNQTGDREYEEYFSRLQKTKGVHLRPLGSMASLASELASSSLYIHPSTYHESFGMLTVQAQAAGCLPVMTDNGANTEVVKNGETGFVTKGKTIWNNNCYQEFIDLVLELLEKDKSDNGLYKNRLEAQKWAKQWNYTKIASKVLEWVA
jgi:glycosyltransferase involved in cell wall biosynthesis